MSNLVIVAIPEENDITWQISTEKVPHLTLLFLGEVGQVQNVDQILNFLQHAAETTLCPFYLEVETRGVLGANDADVIFFRDGWDSKKIKDFRASLLKNDAVFKAHVTEDKFPEWVPHLTLGYPKAPAKVLKDPYQNRIYSVRFDRIALWIDGFEGPEFKLKEKVYYDEDMAVAMSIPKVDLEEVLAHHGVKGMRWGKRKDRSPTSVTVSTTPKGKVKTTGGKNQPAHEDAVTAKVAIQKAKASGIQSLSNKELQALTTRLDLETKVSKLAGDQTTKTGQRVMMALLDESS